MKHRPLSYLSGFLLEAGAAAAAGDGDLALTLWHAQPLAAAGAFKIGVFFILSDGPSKVEPGQDRTGHSHESGVFHLSAFDIPGEHPKQGGGHQGKAGPVQNAQSDKEGDQVDQQIEPDQEQVQRVVPVAAIHKSLDRIADHRAPPWLWGWQADPACQRYCIIISLLHKLVKAAFVNKM